jgi:hypothetical protein
MPTGRVVAWDFVPLFVPARRIEYRPGAARESERRYKKKALHQKTDLMPRHTRFSTKSIVWPFAKA